MKGKQWEQRNHLAESWCIRWLHRCRRRTALWRQNDISDLNGCHLIYPEGFCELYTLKWVTKSQLSTLILFGKTRQRSKASVLLLTCGNPACPSDPVFGYKPTWKHRTWLLKSLFSQSYMNSHSVSNSNLLSCVKKQKIGTTYACCISFLIGSVFRASALGGHFPMTAVGWHLIARITRTHSVNFHGVLLTFAIYPCSSLQMLNSPPRQGHIVLTISGLPHICEKLLCWWNQQANGDKEVTVSHFSLRSCWLRMHVIKKKNKSSKYH